MTTDTTPADRDHHLHDRRLASELLAEALLSLGEIPTDSLLLAGAGSRRGAGPAPGDGATLITSSRLGDLLGPRGAEELVHHLEALAEQGCAELHALLVLGDGRQELHGPVIEDVLRRAGAAIRTATSRVRDGVTLLGVHAAVSGACWTVPQTAPPSGTGASADPPRALGPLAPFSDTRTAASAVLGGRLLPRPGEHAPRLADIGAGLAPAPPDLASAADPVELFTAARSALGTLLAADGPGTRPLSEVERVTKCEQLSAFLSAVAVDRLHWDLLARCVERGGQRRIDREMLLQILVADRSWTPHADICAGGEWYTALMQLREVARAGWRQGPVASRGTARSAWRGLTSLLVLLAWWNHRFRTAGGLVDELRAAEPESSLARLLSRMTDTPILPAWWPAD